MIYSRHAGHTATLRTDIEIELREYTMPVFTLLRRFMIHFTALCLLGAGLIAPAAQAAMVGTGAVLEARTASDTRAVVQAQLARADVQAGLLAQGVNPADVQARVASLSDHELASLATQLDSLPAGAGGLELILLVFVVLLLTDIAGITNIFTFVK